MIAQIPLMGMTLQELRSVAESLHMPQYAATQMAKWLYQKHAGEICQMTDLSQANRERLATTYQVGSTPPVQSQQSADGTIKYLFPTSNGKYVETVYIPEADRATLCVSSQVGCKMGCRFCQTGKQGFEGQLSTCDILNQIFSLPQRDTLTNIVFMGQGEPLDNIDNVLRATEILTANYGCGWSPKRITISSVGIKGKLRRLLDMSRCHIAISMHSPFPEERARLMPAEKQMSITDIMALLREYDFSHQRRISFEYIMFKGVNDSLRHAREIVRLTAHTECRVNLIHFHPIPDVTLEGSDDTTMELFRDFLTRHGTFATIRASRGKDIMAACGLLSTARQNNHTADNE